MTQEKKHKDEISFDYVTRLAKETSLRDGKQPPCMIIDGSRNLLFRVIPEFPGTAAERTRFLHLAGKHEAKSGEAGHIRQIFFISESWISISDANNLPKTLPSQAPNRKEALLVVGLKIQGRVKSHKVFEMIRNNKGRLVDLQEFSLKNEMVDTSLLEAFFEGFQNAFLERVN